MKISCNGIEICKQAIVADSFYKKLKGLMFSESMDGFDGMIFYGTNAIHTCFMNYKIDVVFFNSKNEIKKIYRGLKPWRHTQIVFSASRVLELADGQLPQEIKEGDTLELCIS
ncbi:DUF192 domain-containing protein [Halobacteriovorax sp. GFR7]|uniref:DUF192 domain-containing protein n=1 Tax=unclassified Halobacteriovorax TaxID=2639665 RepID=UPI003D965669